MTFFLILQEKLLQLFFRKNILVNASNFDSFLKKKTLFNQLDSKVLSRFFYMSEMVKNGTLF